MNLKLLVCTFFAVSVICLLPSAATAANGPYFASYGFSPWTYGPPSVYVHENVPYYALYPPVYYSRPVPRTYGHLPFPYLTAPVTGSIARAEPQVIINRYAEESGGTGVRPEATMPRRVHVTYPTAIFEQSK